MRGTMMDFPLTLHHVFERATRLFPEHEIVTGGGSGVAHRYTYRDMDERVRRLASGLLDLGLRPGERVATFAWNTYRHLELYFAVPLLGSVLHTLNIRLFHDQLTYIINHAEDRFLVVDRSLLPTIQALLPTLRTVEKVIVMDDGSDVDPGDAIDFDTIVDRGDGKFEFPPVDEKDAAMMCYTSGTTGNPRGVAYSHRSMLMHSFGVCVSDALGISMHDTTMAVVPMFHANAWGIPYGSALVGAKQVLPGVAPQPERLLNLLQDERVTMAAGVPTIWIGLLPAIQSGAYDLSRLNRLVVGGSAAPRGLIEAYDKVGLTILHAWGMTEMSPIGTVSRLKPDLGQLDERRQMDYRAKQGLSVPGVETRVLDGDGNDVPHDGEAMGELVVRGPWVTGAYYHDDERSAASFTSDGWFRTGDVVTVDAEGYIEIADRTKDLIKSGGEWISSVALENALMAHPKVLEAAVIAAPDERWTERPLACVVPRPEARDQLGDAELTEYLARQFARWWLPDRYLYLDELPKTSVGKFDKKALRQAHAAAARTA
jgi:fatty-acyl-CoA synthase